MLYISEAHKLFNDIKTPSQWNNNTDLRLDAVILTNNIDYSFGRTYFRTCIHIISNFYLNYSDTYISYRIADHRKGKELIDNCNSVYFKQIQDVLELRTHIKQLFPNTSVLVYMVGHDFIGTMKTRYSDELVLTGRVSKEILEPMNAETTKNFNSIKNWYRNQKKTYLKRKTGMVKYLKEKRKQERLEAQNRISYFERLREINDREQELKSIPHAGLSKLEQHAQQLKKKM